MQAMRCLPCVSAAPWAMEDALLVACHGGAQEQAAPAELLRPAFSFAAAWDMFVASAGAHMFHTSEHLLHSFLRC